MALKAVIWEENRGQEWGKEDKETRMTRMTRIKTDFFFRCAG
jgi:hypothetical protein